MEIQLTAKQFNITPALREYVQQKMGKTQKYFDHIVWGQAFLFVEKRSHKAEMIVHAPGQTFRALATAADLYSAIDLASDKIDAQLKKACDGVGDLDCVTKQKAILHGVDLELDRAPRKERASVGRRSSTRNESSRQEARRRFQNRSRRTTAERSERRGNRATADLFVQ